MLEKKRPFVVLKVQSGAGFGVGDANKSFEKYYISKQYVTA